MSDIEVTIREMEIDGDPILAYYAGRLRESLRQVPEAKPLVDRLPRESECTAEAAHHFYAQGWNACRDAIANHAQPTSVERRFRGVGELERSGYIPEGSADEREATPAQAGAITLDVADDVLTRFLALSPSGDHWPPERARALRIEAMRDAINASIKSRSQELPRLPQAFFDEFGESADDRVMDFARAYANSCAQAGAELPAVDLAAENSVMREALSKISRVNACDYEYVRWAREALSSLARRGCSSQVEAELPERKRSLVNSMVDRFLCWRLPDDFHPDSGVSFTPIDHPHMWPVGTNLLTAAQAKRMVEHMLAGAVPPDTYSEAEGDAYTHGFFDGMDEAETKREPIGHLYRVAHFDEAAARPWASEGTVFVAGPAPIEGRRGAIQYVNVYTADSLARRGGSDG